MKSDLAVTGEWATYNFEWCAWFVTWLLHNNGIGYEVGASDPYATYEAMGRVGNTPQVGALIFFNTPVSHVGLVIGTNGTSCETVEGNAGDNPWPSSVVHHNFGRVGSKYAYPVYADQDSLPPGPGTPTIIYQERDMFLVQRVLDGNPTLNGMTAAMGPGFFQHLGTGDLDGIARDLKIPDSQIIKGQETNGGNGLPAAEFSRLVSLFQIPAQYVKPGGRYLAGGSMNT
ncbi:MAG: CHAP domain-containing protein [Leifsonia sp.]